MPSKRTLRSARPTAAIPDDLLEVESYVPGQTLPPERSPDVYARWFFDFLRADFSTLTPGQLLGMCADLRAFVHPEVVPESWGVKQLPPVEMLPMFQRDARAGIQRLLEQKEYGLEKGIQFSIATVGKYITRTSLIGTPEDLFRLAVMTTIQEFWDRLYRCPRCNELFLKVGKQKYCSPTCASRAHWERFKSRRAARDHHREYTGRVRKRLGSNVKVATKPRRKM